MHARAIMKLTFVHGEQATNNLIGVRDGQGFAWWNREIHREYVLRSSHICLTGFTT